MNEIVEETKKNRTVIDQHNQCYELTGRVGEGGQGIVCTTNYPKVLVKIARLTTDEQRTFWLNKIQNLIRQPLQGLPIAYPLALIAKPQLGYVMEMMDGLVPLTHLMQITRDSLISGSGIVGYIETGGLQRRLKILARLARILAELHGRGLAYGDLSDSNVFVSKSLEYSEVWLIDADNISSLSCEGSRVWSPDYGAPEILRGESGINTLTDSWSFAVLAYSLLTTAHPLKGDDVMDGDYEFEEMALQGRLPWVDHPTNTSNALSVGLPREIVLNSQLRNLFEQCFNAGLEEPGERPSLSEWAEAFELASRQCVNCVSCDSTFFYSSRNICPFCDDEQPSDQGLIMAEYIYTPPKIIWEQFCESQEYSTECPSGFSNRDWESLSESEKDFISEYCWQQTDNRFVLTDQKVELGKSSFIFGGDDSSSLCVISLTKKGEPEIIPGDSKPISLSRQGGKSALITSKYVFNKEKRSGKRGELHLGPVNEEHIVWQFKW